MFIHLSIYSDFLCWPVGFLIISYLIFTCLCTYFTLFLISNLNILCQKNMICVILVFLNMLRLVLEPRIWSILKNVLCALGKSVYADFLKCNVLFITSKSIWPFNTALSLLVFFLGDPSFDVQGMLTSSTFIVLLFLPLCLLIFTLCIYMFLC